MKKIKLLIIILSLLTITGCSKKYSLSTFDFSVPSAWECAKVSDYNYVFYNDNSEVLDIELFTPNTYPTAINLLTVAILEDYPLTTIANCRVYTNSEYNEYIVYGGGAVGNDNAVLLDFASGVSETEIETIIKTIKSN